ncbi:unnamed protein product [Oikopleura dioica]|uniref:Uncharacterized protein n=1 Tax=Oikopleura dioica TaxID=34765 RepID=E4Y3F5_OIKDI|nr:unnamed protein product [Oikopleura dioica]
MQYVKSFKNSFTRKRSAKNKCIEELRKALLISNSRHCDRAVIQDLLETVMLKSLVKGKTSSSLMERTRKRRFLNLSYPLTDPDRIYSNYANTEEHDRFPKSMSLRSMRDRRRNGAKNNRGPAFIFGKNAANQNEIELRFLEGI